MARMARPVTLALELQRLRRSGLAVQDACDLLAADHPQQAELLARIARRASDEAGPNRLGLCVCGAPITRPGEGGGDEGPEAAPALRVG